MHTMPFYLGVRARRTRKRKIKEKEAKAAAAAAAAADSEDPPSAKLTKRSVSQDGMEYSSVELLILV